jgi:hypothetical protein
MAIFTDDERATLQEAVGTSAKADLKKLAQIAPWLVQSWERYDEDGSDDAFGRVLLYMPRVLNGLAYIAQHLKPAHGEALSRVAQAFVDERKKHKTR